MILLELTEKEIDFLKEVITLEKQSVADSKSEWAEKERKIGICNTFLIKVEKASEPQRDVVITANDLFLLISQAKREYQNLSTDMHISRERVDKKDFPHVSMANAVIMFLNEKKLLKRLARFDVTDQSNQYEEMEE